MQKKVTVGWFGDTHIGQRQYGLARRHADFAQAYLSALQDMIAQKVDFIIHTGDMTHSSRPSPEDVLVLEEGEQMLVDANIQMFVIPGQHDGYGEHWTKVVGNGDHNRGYRVLRNESVESQGLRIMGLVHASRDSLLQVFANEVCHGDILMLHQAVQEFIGFPAPSALKVDDLPRSKFSVIAIGDIHIHKIVQDGLNNSRKGNCVFGYAGSTELGSASEPDHKGWVKLVFESATPQNKMILRGWKMHTINTRPVIRLNLQTEEDVQSGLITIASAVTANEAAGETRKPIVFVRYSNILPKVLERFYAAFNPDKFVFQFDPVFKYEKPVKPGEVREAEVELTVDDIRKQKVPADSAIFEISAAALSQDLDFSAEVDRFIDKRLAAVPAEVTSE